MSGRIRGRLSYANVMATLALFIALGGGAWAVAIGRNDVGSREIARNAVGTSELKNDKVKGRDVDESSLGPVPVAQSAQSATSSGTAASAGTADTVGGQRVVPFTYRSDATGDPTILATVGGLGLQASCGGADNDLFLYNRSGGPAELTNGNVDDAPNTTGGAEEVVANDDFVSVSGGVPDDDGTTGQAGFFTQAGKSVRVFYTLDESQFGSDCSISGVVIG